MAVIQLNPRTPGQRFMQIADFSELTKKEPDTFLADDGTICRVPADRFRDTPVHTLVYCNWQ